MTAIKNDQVRIGTEVSNEEIKKNFGVPHHPHVKRTFVPKVNAPKDPLQALQTAMGISSSFGPHVLKYTLVHALSSI